MDDFKSKSHSVNTPKKVSEIKPDKIQNIVDKKILDSQKYLQSLMPNGDQEKVKISELFKQK